MTLISIFADVFRASQIISSLATAQGREYIKRSLELMTEAEKIRYHILCLGYKDMKTQEIMRILSDLVCVGYPIRSALDILRSAALDHVPPKHKDFRRSVIASLPRRSRECLKTIEERR